MRKLTIATNVIALAWITIACQPVDQVQKPGNDGLQLPDVPYVYDHTIQPNDNIPTLGRVLFYDPRLSANSAISCSSCHKQNLAFADNLAFSLGFGQQKTKRNALTIQNEIDPVHPMDSILLFWDGRESLLPVMVLDPIVNSAEMGNTDINTVVSKLANLPEYQDLFQKAYGNPSVNSQLIAQALTAFIDNFQSRTSAFDLSKSQGLNLTASEMNGHFLFLTKYNCNACHQLESPDGLPVPGSPPDSLNTNPPDSLSTNYTGARNFVNIGLDSTFVDDIGRADVTGLPSDVGKFKIPSLRNVALSAPYMHDGRFATLSEVIDHYSHGIANTPNLDVRLKDGPNALRMNVTDSEKQDLIAFLNTLTDQKMLTDPRLSNPFPPK